MSYSFDGDQTVECRHFSTLDRRARAIAAALSSTARPGSRVLCLYRPGLDFVDALFGCFYAGMIAVPTYPLKTARGAIDRSAVRVQAIRKSCTPSVVLADQASAGAIRTLVNGEIPVIVTDAGAAPDELADTWVAPDISADTTCLLQYTSGSTADPRGVVLTHGRLLANSAAIRAAFGHTPASRGVLWLPHEHDMGLVGAILQPIYGMESMLLMSPLGFVQQPLAWLRAISRTRATTAGGPNFAYEMCLDRSSDEELDGLDLSSWDVAFVGAEPVRSATLAGFARRFAPAGFKRSAFLPCYGLAEATLIVTGAPKSTGPRTLSVSRDAFERGSIEPAGDRSIDLVSSGVPAGSEVRVVSPEKSRPVGPGEIGEIWVKGPSVASGYWGLDGDRTFDGALAGEEGAFLRTGDLGFTLDGEIYITGRMKDLIIVDGANHYPEDIEQSVDGCHPDLRPGAGAVFGVDRNGSEGVVVVWETRRARIRDDRAALVKAIRAAIARDHDVPIIDVVLTLPARVPRTESGKLKRFECRRSYLEGTLQVEANSVDAR